MGPIPHTPIIPSDEDIQVDGDTFTTKTSRRSTILFDPLIKTGVVRFEVQNVYYLRAVGIADETVRYERDDDAFARGFDKIVSFCCWGKVRHIGNWIEGLAEFKNKKVGPRHKTQNPGNWVALEVNMDSNPRTLSFFVNGVKQPIYVTNIPPAVRFWAYLNDRDDVFRVIKFEAIPEPTVVNVKGSHSLEYGTEWKSKCAIQ
ncbi:MAG: hypothetical protein EZS28_023716 [Streblomastix strix]|uniref:SPRY domain-containing protein n=1 Tax=Streblomastix strix TaxID=222440 RepID=A0A5J4VE94_9EUKA|nr:MAG: hypothetical protein EZS28_023716 [Streblomastix strix]